MKVSTSLLVILVIVDFTIAGCIISIKPSTEKPTAQPLASSWRCEPVPDNFQETDLVGTWQTIFGMSLTDTLNISETGFYTQVSVDNATSYHYESEPHKWWVERRDDGGTYIHFERMLFCGGVLDCIDPHEKPGYYDFCSDHWFEMEDEFVLAVVGDKSVPRGMRLRHMRPAGFETFFANYTIVEK